MGPSLGGRKRRTGRPLAVLAVGVLATCALAATAQDVHRTSERDMLDQRSAEVVKTLDAVLPLLQVPLSSGLAVAGAAPERAPAFDRVVGRFVGPTALMRSASLWDLGPKGAALVTSIGARSTLERLSPRARAAHLGRASSGGISIVDLTGARRRALGFAASSHGGTERLVAYLEAPIPDDPTALDLTGDAFEDLDIEVHLGPGRAPSRLLFATTRRLPLAADAPTRTVPWGDAELVLVFAPKGELGDPLLGKLPLAILATGLTLAACFAVLMAQLEQSRRATVRHADETEQLYLRERTVAHRLQHELLPDPLPSPRGVVLASRYEAGADGVEIGGDWYDVVPVDDDHVLVTVGDVSGQGIGAASVMVSLRAAIRAYALDGHGPGAILERLGRLLDVRADGHFATVLCVCVHVHEGRAVVATAGHPPPVVTGEDGATLSQLPVGLPIGVSPTATYEEQVLPLHPGQTLVCFTDGLFERRGEMLDAGLDRVRRTAAELAAASVADLVAGLTDRLVAPTTPDDTAVIAVRLAPQAGRESATSTSASASLAVAP